MSLVTYSDSEGSEGEAPAPSRPPPTNLPNAGRSTFKKVVDHSNPHKIRVNLPEPTKTITTDGNEDEDGPRVKRVKAEGSGAFSGFNALLPAPKRDGSSKTSLKGGGASSSGLGAGLSLKTGATPGFSRERVEIEAEDETPNQETPTERDASTDANGSNVAATTARTTNELPKPVTDHSLPKKTAMFRPLSVARKPGVKKTNRVNRIEGGLSAAAKAEGQQSAAPSKKSFFSFDESVAAQSVASPEPDAFYKPLIYEANAEVEEAHSATDDLYANIHSDQDNPLPDPNSLDSIASTLKLSESEKRQLFGRHKKHDPGLSSAISITNLNMDSEYAANEELRQAGEQAQHNPVRSINAAGKNSLKSLVSTASTQRDALEEQFASGRRNKREAGGRYGW